MLTRYPAVPSAASLLEQVLASPRELTVEALRILNFDLGYPCYGDLAAALQGASFVQRADLARLLGPPPPSSPFSGDWRSPTQKAADALLASGLFPLAAK